MLRWLCVACALAYGFAMDLCLKRGDFNLAFLCAAISVILALIAWKIPDKK